MGRLLDVAYNIEYGNVTTEQSSLNLVYLLGFQPVPGDFRIFGSSDERYHIAGGNEQLPRAIAAALAPGTVVLNTALTGIAFDASKKTYTLTLTSGRATTTQTFDRVIMAIPFSVLRGILTSDAAYRAAGFDPLKQTAITELGYGANAKLQLQFDSRYWNSSGPWGIGNGLTYSDTGYQNTWDVTRAQDGRTGILVDYTGGGHPLASFQGDPTPADAIAYAKTFLSQLEPVFPGISHHWNGLATLDVPLTNPFALGSYSYWKVGQYTQFSGYEKARQPDPTTGKCHFAGEHCSTNFQGFMEGGAEEGARAAGEILSD
jgi:monoamine oxidase